jgi:hypothetical protein
VGKTKTTCRSVVLSEHSGSILENHTAALALLYFYISGSCLISVLVHGGSKAVTLYRLISQWLAVFEAEDIAKVFKPVHFQGQVLGISRQ